MKLKLILLGLIIASLCSPLAWAESYDFKVDAKLFKRIDKRLNDSKILREHSPSDSFAAKCATAIEVEQARLVHVDVASDKQIQVAMLEHLKQMIIAESTQSASYQSAAQELKELISAKDFLDVDKELIVSRIDSLHPTSLAMSACLIAGMEKNYYFTHLIDTATARENAQDWRAAYNDWLTVNDREDGFYKMVIAQRFSDVLVDLSFKMKRGLL